MTPAVGTRLMLWREKGRKNQRVFEVVRLDPARRLMLLVWEWRGKPRCAWEPTERVEDWYYSEKGGI